jgi:hypothetical protein
LVVGHPKLQRERERERERERKRKKESCTWTTHSLEFESLQAPPPANCLFFFASLSTALQRQKQNPHINKNRPIIT